MKLAIFDAPAPVETEREVFLQLQQAGPNPYLQLVDKQGEPLPYGNLLYFAVEKGKITARHCYGVDGDVVHVDEQKRLIIG